MQPPAVLLIDGDRDSLTIYSVMLEHHGYRVLRASNGNDGVRLAAEAKPRVIVLEPYTPCQGTGGILDALRADPAIAAIPVIVLTAAPAYLRTGEDDFPADRLFTKPMQPVRLLQVLEGYLRPELPPIPV